MATDTSTSTWRDGLTNEQLAAASHAGSHARLLAGPGTGKSHTLARRVASLVVDHQVPPSDILVLTFTRAATRELRSRIFRQLKPHTDELPNIATLHSFALRQLMANSRSYEALPRPLRIADDWEEREIVIDDLKRQLDMPVKDVKEGFKRLSSDWETLAADSDYWRRDFPDPRFLGAWEEHRSLYGYTLRSELVYQLKRALSQAPNFTLESRFRYILIDEYQDLNPCDLAIAEALTAQGAFLMACGDDDQSIYGFRHANPDGIRGFTQTFIGSADLVLSECRRCGPQILEAAVWVAKQDTRRVEKSLRSAPEVEAGSVDLLAFLSGVDEYQGIARIAAHLIKKGEKPGEILILLRSDHDGAYSTPLRHELERRSLPVAPPLDKRSVLDEVHGRRVLAILQLIANDNDHLAWRAMVQVTARLGNATVQPICEFARQNGIGFGVAIKRVDEFATSVPSQARSLLKRMIDQTCLTISTLYDENDAPSSVEGLRSLVEKVAKSELTEEIGREQVIAHFESVLSESQPTTLGRLLTSIAIGRQNLDGDLSPAAINIMTMHRAKGLEADNVILMAIEDELIPSDVTQNGIDDDRRLLYVSMTRARKRLYITYSGDRRGPQMHTGRNSGIARRQISRFLANSPLQASLGSQFVSDLE